MEVLLISTYELGRQPFGLASPAAMLRADGHSVTCVDAAIARISLEAVQRAEVIAFYLPMHTATRLAQPIIERVKLVNPAAKLVCYGIYAILNEQILRETGVAYVLGGEFEEGLRAVCSAHQPADRVSQTAERVSFVTPDRAGLPALSEYAGLIVLGERRTVGYTEASRGCKHWCRHCPVVPAYQGKFRVVPPDVVLADIRQQVAAGARHITFGDPDFWNGPRHAERVVAQLHAEFPDVTYDVTVKIEHLLKHREMLPVLKETGCLLVTSAVESVDDAVLARLNKGHTRADFEEAVRLCRAAGLNLSPTFIAFTPWTLLEGYRDLLRALIEFDLVENVAPVQLALRLLVFPGSLLAGELAQDWRHADPSMDALAHDMLTLVDREQKRGRSRTEIFAAVCDRAGLDLERLHPLVSRATIPYLTEPWYC